MKKIWKNVTTKNSPPLFTRGTFFSLFFSLRLSGFKSPFFHANDKNTCHTFFKRLSKISKNEEQFVASLSTCPVRRLKMLETLSSGAWIKISQLSGANSLNARILRLYQQNMLSRNEAVSYIRLFLQHGIALFPALSIAQYDREMRKLEQNTSIFAGKIAKINEVMENLDYLIIRDIFPFLTQTEKELVDYIELKNNIYDVKVNKYNMYSKGQFQDSNYMQINEIIQRGYIFTSQSGIFNSLKQIFLVDELYERIDNKNIFSCYSHYARLGVMGKKALTSKLLHQQKETIIFNLLSHGLNLNWKIRIDEKDTIVGLEALSSLPMIKVILSSDCFDMTITTPQGENILHLLGTQPLTEGRLKLLLNKKIAQLNDSERNQLFTQKNHYGMTPLMKAIFNEETILIDYLEHECALSPTASSSPSALEFLDNELLQAAHNHTEEVYGKYIDDYAYSFWQDLSRKWHSEHNYHTFSENFKNHNSLRNKVVKI